MVRPLSLQPRLHVRMSSTLPVLAAGAVVVRSGPTGPEVLAVHRPRYDDWSLPKGHREDGEALPSTAVREVAEETGVRIRLSAPLDTSRYPVNGHPKEVRWWRGEAVADTGSDVDDEVDTVRWLPQAEAERLLTFDSDRALVRQAVGLGQTTAILLVRHGKAVARVKWEDDDRLRPLTGRGRRQARTLVPLLSAFGPRRVVASRSVRCADTVRPYAETAGVRLETTDELTEETAAVSPARPLAYTEAVTRDALTARRPALLCGHRPVLPTMLEVLGLPNRPMEAADCVVAHLTTDGEPLAVEHYPAEREL